MNIHTDVHPREDTPITGRAGSDALVGVYPYIKIGGPYPGVNIFAGDMRTLVRIADAALDALVAMVERGAEIDRDTGIALGRLSGRTMALAFDEQAETEAVKAVQQ